MSSGEAGDWAAAAREALDTRKAGPGVQLMDIDRPPFLDVLTDLAALPLAAVAWSGAIFREMVAAQPLDPIALLLRALAIGLTVRSVVAIVAATRRVSLWARRDRYGLAVSDAGLVLRAPGTPDRVVPREDVWGIRERGDWRERARARAEPVYLVHRPRGGSPWLALPPIFAGGPGLLAEALMRRMGGRRSPEDETSPDVDGEAPLPSRAYDLAARGTPGDGVIALRHGWRWWLRGPQATVLLGLAILDGFTRLPRATQVEIAPVALGAAAGAVLLIPALWLLLAGRHVRPRRGLSLVLTPREILLRTRHGVVATRHHDVRRAHVVARVTWSPFTGSSEQRVLVLERVGDDGPIRYDEAFLGVPAEVVIALIDAYRRGDVTPEMPGVVVS